MASDEGPTPRDEDGRSTGHDASTLRRHGMLGWLLLRLEGVARRIAYGLPVVDTRVAMSASEASNSSKNYR